MEASVAGAVGKASGRSSSHHLVPIIITTTTTTIITIIIKHNRRHHHRQADGEEAVQDPRLQELLRQSVASFSDGINSGFYINSYTTKQCPTMEGSGRSQPNNQQSLCGLRIVEVRRAQTHLKHSAHVFALSLSLYIYLYTYVWSYTTDRGLHRIAPATLIAGLRMVIEVGVI